MYHLRAVIRLAIIRKSSGFSLVEMLTTLGVIATIAIVSIPILSNYTANRDLKSAARIIAAEIFELKERAMSESRVYQIDFNQEANSFTVQRCLETGSHCPSGEFENIAIRSLNDVSRDVKILSANFSGRPVIRFQTRGTANPGKVKLKNRLESEASVTVNITGRTYVQSVLK
jgi:Tfp pilus assembly protein FimT